MHCVLCAMFVDSGLEHHLAAVIVSKTAYITLRCWTVAWALVRMHDALGVDYVSISCCVAEARLQTVVI